MINVFHDYISELPDIIEDARNGKMFILVDAEDRENEGDLVIPAQMCTPQTINFMARFGRGLICLAMNQDRADQLKLPMMAALNRTRNQTAFTVSIEAKEGISTGISAHDRAHTISVAIDPTKGPDDIVMPGHVFPLVARHGGVLVRTGHTEAAVDVARLAGLYPAGVICEIMNDDGTMARLPDLVKFAQFHNLKIATIADLIAYRRINDNLVRREIEMPMESRWGGKYQVIIYRNVVDGSEHIALVKGDVANGEPVLVRVHALQVFYDVLGVVGRSSSSLHGAMKQIGEAGRGVVVIIREQLTSPLAGHVKGFLAGQKTDYGQLRDYGVGAQILIDLGVRDMILLSNTERNIVGLDGYGLTVVETRPTPHVEGD